MTGLGEGVRKKSRGSTSDGGEKKGEERGRKNWQQHTNCIQNQERYIHTYQRKTFISTVNKQQAGLSDR